MDINEQVAAGLAMNLKMAGLKMGTGAVALFLVVVVDVAPLVAISYLCILFNVSSGMSLSIRNFRQRQNPKPEDVWWDKDKWFRTAMKLIWFPAALIVSRYIEAAFDVGIPVAKAVAVFISYRDFWSGIDNVSALTGVDIWKAIGHQFKNVFSREKGPSL